MRERWLEERHHEHYYKLAKKLDYRSRASFKLMQIDDRFKIFREGDSVVDLGACPGGWLQVAKERVGDGGRVVGIDLRRIRPMDGVVTIVGDITEDSTLIKLTEVFEGKADVVVSDMAPNMAGHYSMDHARSIDLCMYAVDVCDRALKKEGKLVMKAFMGDMFEDMLKEVRTRFRSVKVHSPAASREASSEMYVICKGFLANRNVRLVREEPAADAAGTEFTIKGNLI